ncbi:MAG: TolC family protein [Desulfotignum sp.]|nr:TolC family protein [Desulfotignum sp.]
METQRNFLLFFVILLTTCIISTTNVNTAFCAEPFNTNPYYLLTQVLENHEEIKNFKHQVESSQAALKSSQGQYYPKVNLYGDTGWEKIEKEYSQDTEETRHNVTLRATQLITDFGRTLTTIDQERVQMHQNKTRLDAVRQQILQEGISAYISIVRARDRLKTAIRSENRIKELTGIEESLVEKGAGLSSDVLQAKSQLAGAKALKVSAQGELITARNRFQAIFYHYPTDEEIEQFMEIPFPESAIPETLDTAIETALNNNLQIAVTQQDVDLQKNEVKLSKTAFYPTLHLFAEAVNADDDDGTLGYRRDYAAGIEFNYNLFNGGSDYAALKSATAGADAAQSHLAHARKLVQEQVSNGWEQLFILRQRFQLLDNQTDILKNFLELAKKERKMGTRSLLDVLNGEVNYINAQGNAIAAREDIKIAAFNLLFSMGTIHLDLLENL